MNGKGNRYNVVIRGFEDTHELKNAVCISEKVTKWYALLIDWVIRPYFYDNPIFTCGCKFHLLNNRSFAMLSDLLADSIIQRAGVPPRCNRAVQDLLNEEISDSCIGQEDPVNWPAFFPTLLLLTFLFGV